MKLLLYCTKAKPYLYDHLGIRRSWDKRFNTEKIKQSGLDELLLNGKIVAECDFEVEEIYVTEGAFATHTLNEKELLNKSCLTFHQMFDYFVDTFNYGYAIHVKNLHIFDKPRELGMAHYTTLKSADKIQKAPQNMCIVRSYYPKDYFEKYVLISIRPEWLCKILNGEKTIEVRKKVLKEMLK